MDAQEHPRVCSLQMAIVGYEERLRSTFASISQQIHPRFSLERFGMVFAQNSLPSLQNFFKHQD